MTCQVQPPKVIQVGTYASMAGCRNQVKGQSSTALDKNKKLSVSNSESAVIEPNFKVVGNTNKLKKVDGLGAKANQLTVPSAAPTKTHNLIKPLTHGIDQDMLPVKPFSTDKDSQNES